MEPRRSHPLIDLRFFRSPPFTGANTISIAMSASLGGFLFLNTLYLQDIRGLTPLHAGLVIIPMTVGQRIAANRSGRHLATRADARLPPALGGALLATGAFLLVSMTARTGTAHLLAAYAIVGVGVGLIGPPVTTIAVAGMPADQVGVGGALIASARQFGSSIGVAVTGSIVTSTGSGFVDSSHTAWVVLGGCGIVALALDLLSTTSWAKTAATRNGRRLADASFTSISPRVQPGTLSTDAV